MENKSKKLIQTMSVIFITTLAVAFLLMFIGNQMRANTVKEQQSIENYTEWLANNCNCTARNEISCLNGFELENNTCMNGKYYTNVLEICTEYKCSGKIEIWNNETEQWGSE